MAIGKYLDLLIDLGIDLVGVYLLAVVLYYRRHRRGDLLLAYFALNIGLFVTMSLLSSVRVDISTGFGLFAILSIIQLRSSTIQQEETAYYFAVLVLGLVNGLRLHDRLTTVILDAALIAVMYLVDHRELFTRSHRADIVLDVIHTDDEALVADLERRLRGRVVHHIVEDIDYVRESTLIDVRYTPDLSVAPPTERVERPGVAATTNSEEPKATTNSEEPDTAVRG
jgi:hypothetical protein